MAKIPASKKNIWCGWPGKLSAEGLAKLNHGLSLDGQPLRPAKVWWQNDDQLRFVLREGKKRQIRRMCDLVGLRVLGLKRIRIGKSCWATCRRASGAIWRQANVSTEDGSTSPAGLQLAVASAFNFSVDGSLSCTAASWLPSTIATARRMCWMRH